MWWLSFSLCNALAQEPDPGVSPEPTSNGPELTSVASDPAAFPALPNRGEYQRLSQELEKLASRNAWAGVERTYTALLATGIEPSFEDFVAGAHAARALGDVASARNRLIAANTRREERAVVDWLWDIDSNYNRVLLACDIGKVELQPESMPFDPNQRKAVEYAQKEIAEKGIFDGYLPQGRYMFGKEPGPDGAERDRSLAVEPRVQSIAFDIRTEEGIREAQRIARKAEKKAEKDAVKQE